MDEKTRRDEVVDLLINKAAMKQDIADYSEKVIEDFKKIAQDELDVLRKHIDDDRVRLSFRDKGTFDFRLFVGSDVLVFQLHTNIFRLPDENPLWNTEYLKENGANGYFAIINIYNFLAESLEQHRLNDYGYLIGRIFLNHDHHFIVEGKGQLGFLFRDLENGVMTNEVVRQIIQSSMQYAIEFDLITPPYDLVQEVSLGQVRAMSSDLQIATGKRLGFKFSARDQDIF